MTNNEGILKDPNNTGGYIRVAPDQDTEILGMPSRNDTRTVLYGGNGYSKGASIMLNGSNYGTTLGAFTLHANDGTNRSILAGYSDGSLKLNSGTIDSILEFEDSYIKYQNGLAICWLLVSGTNSDPVTVTLPIAFKDLNYRCIGSDTGSARYPIGISRISTSSISVYSGNANWGTAILAIGRWK